MYLRKVRKTQKMQLGRYGHQSVFVWEDIDLAEFRDWYSALGDVITEEHPSATEAENLD